VTSRVDKIYISERKCQTKGQTMDLKIDRSDAGFTDSKTLHDEDVKYWSSASVEEKLEMITFLRECFYGEEATTGRLQRFFEFVEQE
jgi:hypothetical protein